MKEKENPFELFNLPLNADPKKIKERYYALSKVFHPDKQSFEMYSHSKQYFEKIEEAYKAIASPFNRFIYEHLGHEGVHMVEKAHNKFVDLEEAYELHYESYQEALKNPNYYEQSGQLSERKRRLKEIEQSILNRNSFLIRKVNEREIAIRYYKNSCSTTLDLTRYFENSNPKKFPPKNYLFLSNLMISSTIHLPEFYKIQPEFGFLLVGSNKNEFKTGFILGLHRLITLPIIKNVEVKVNLAFTNQNNSIGLVLSKPTDFGIFQLNANVTNDGFAPPTLTLNKSIGENSTVIMSTFLSTEDFKMNPVFIHNFKKYNLKSKTDLDLSSDSTEVSQTFIKKINKNLALTFGVNLKMRFSQQSPREKNVTLQMMNFLGLKYNLSKVSMIEIVYNVGLGENGVTFNYSRYSFHLSIPLTFSHFPTKKGIISQLCFLGASFGLIKLCEMRKKKNPRRKIKMLRNNKIRLIEHRSGFNMFLNDINQIAEKSFNKEKKLLLNKKKGLVILKAFYGHQNKIKEIVKKENSKDHKADNLEALISHEIASGLAYVNENDIFSEILDIRTILQYFIKCSCLEFRFDNFKKIPGIYNPCVDENHETALFIQYLYGDNVKILVLKKGHERCEIGRLSDYAVFSLIDFIFKRLNS